MNTASVALSLEDWTQNPETFARVTFKPLWHRLTDGASFVTEDFIPLATDKNGQLTCSLEASQSYTMSLRGPRLTSNVPIFVSGSGLLNVKDLVFAPNWPPTGSRPFDFLTYYWPLDDTSASGPLLPKSGSIQLGKSAANCIPQASGKHNRAIQFDFQAPFTSSASITFNKNYSLSFWLKTPSPHSYSDTIILQMVGGATGWWLDLSFDGSLLFLADANNGIQVMTGQNVITDDVFHLVVLKVDSAGTCFVSVDNGNFAQSPSPIITPVGAATLEVGDSGNDDSQVIFDELAIYSSAILQSYVRELWNNGAGKFY